MNREDLSFLKDMFQCKVSEIQQRLIVVNQSKTTVLESEFENIQVINDRSFGLSRSRNIAINYCDSKFAWILDDDVIIKSDAVESIVLNMNKYPSAGLLVFQIETPSGKLKRDYFSHDKQAKRNKEIAHIHSIEMVLNIEIIKKQEIKFNERFGLGSQFIMGEEYILAKELFDRNHSILLISKPIVIHSEISTGMDPASNKVIYARGAQAARHNLWLAPVLQLKYVFFLWRKGYVKGWRNLYDKYMVFSHGINDYLIGFEGHRIGHPDL